MTDMSSRAYELVYIVQPELDDGAVDDFRDRMIQLITDQEGEMLGTEMWGRRVLAYPMNKVYEGHYLLHRFTMPPQGTDEIDRYLRLNEDVMRFMLIKTDE